MTTFKNNSKYAELLFTYLDAAFRDDTPLSVPEVLSRFVWRFKGGNLKEAAERTRLSPETSDDFYPDCLASDLAKEWPEGRNALALRAILRARLQDGRLRSRGVLARLGSYQMVVSEMGLHCGKPILYSGMKSVYHVFGAVWDWSLGHDHEKSWGDLMCYTRELLVGSSGVSRAHVPTVEKCREVYEQILRDTRVPGLLLAVKQVKELIKMMGGAAARRLAKFAGQEERARWEVDMVPGGMDGVIMSDQQERTMFLTSPVGPLMLRVMQGVAVVGMGQTRFALSMCDVERLHQVLMSSASAIVGVAAQASVGTVGQKAKARRAVEIAQNNLARIVKSSRLVALGDEVLVCKGYRRAYTALLGVMAGALCTEETKALMEEAKSTAPEGVLDVEGLIWEGKTLDAASALNASKMFKVCPAPDVSPGGAMIDRILTIGDGNTVDHDMMPEFEAELRSQILRAYIRSKKGRLKLRVPTNMPAWYGDYQRGEFDKVPSTEIDTYLKWEGDAEMPDVCKFDPSNWKDSGLGSDTLKEGLSSWGTKHKNNMVTRLLFDDECPMPGRPVTSAEHVIKFFMKAEGHKEPARGIFSANLVDRQAQSWMERAVDEVARQHPSYMIGQALDEKDARVLQLTMRPQVDNEVALFYSFDISGWSGKMPAEPQRISHGIWANLYGGHLFSQASVINEGAVIYLNMDGYKGWFRNTHANLEGFNGKEMTMVLVALLSLSVKRWRLKVVTAGMMTETEANRVSALLFAYIDDGMCRIDLPKRVAKKAFAVYKQTVNETFAACGFTVETSKCFPSDRFAIFLNEVYMAGRHVVHGVRAAMAISSEPTERHASLIERVSNVSTGVRGAVMAGLDPLSGVMLMAYHTYLHLTEWVAERDPVILAGWSLCPRAWGGMGLPNMMQLYMTGSGSAFEESVATMQIYAEVCPSVERAFMSLARTPLEERDAIGVLVAPLSGRVTKGYMVDSRVAVAVRSALQWRVSNSNVSKYARRLLQYANTKDFRRYAEAIIARDPHEVVQEQMLLDLSEAHPHSIFSAFARRLEKSSTVRSIVGVQNFADIIRDNRDDAVTSVSMYRRRTY